MKIACDIFLSITGCCCCCIEREREQKIIELAIGPENKKWHKIFIDLKKGAFSISVCEKFTS